MFKIEYEQYFGGGRPRPPADTEWRIEQILKRYADRSAVMSFAQRFRFNNLAQTYVKFREIYRKRFKQKEEGTVQRHYGTAAKWIEAERGGKRRARAALPGQPELLFAMVCSDPDHEAEKVEQLYQAFFQAKQRAGEDTNQLHLDTFQAFVRRKTEQLRKQKDCKEVEYLVAVEDGRVRLKARAKA